MKLYFKSGKTKRLAIDTEDKTYCTDYSYLGGWKSYYQLSRADMVNLIDELKRAGYTDVDSL